MDSGRAAIFDEMGVKTCWKHTNIMYLWFTEASKRSIFCCHEKSTFTVDLFRE